MCIGNLFTVTGKVHQTSPKCFFVCTSRFKGPHKDDISLGVWLAESPTYCLYLLNPIIYFSFLLTLESYFTYYGGIPVWSHSWFKGVTIVIADMLYIWSRKLNRSSWIFKAQPHQINLNTIFY